MAAFLPTPIVAPHRRYELEATMGLGVLPFGGAPTSIELHLYVGIDEHLQLARDLAVAVFEFHKIRWWYKSISSYNVLLFFGDTVPPPECYVRGNGDPKYQRLVLGRPYLIGFSHSRPEDAGYSNKMHSESALFAYRHPDYAGADAANAEQSPGYLAKYDYYSLGLVLLEIGVWNRLRRLYPDKTLSKEDMRKEILRDLVPVLEATLGMAYASAVRSCLSGELSGSGKTPDPGSVDESFERLVLRPLEMAQPRFDTN